MQMKKKRKATADRRGFLRGAFGVGALGVLGPSIGAAEEASSATTGKPASIPPVNAAAEFVDPPVLPQLTFNRSGSDFMVDVVKTLDVKYVAANPGSSFRGLQESLINYGRNTMPEFLTCCHEESAVAMAHGYFKIAGKPMAALIHGTVGLQHASMAIYNAYADRVPVLLISGNSLDANTRRVWVEWTHSAQDDAGMVRDYLKWDDMPVSLQHFAESQVRAVKLAMAVPRGPVLLSVDADLQEHELSPSQNDALSIPKLSLDRSPQGDAGAIEEAADLLCAATFPVIVADKYSSTAAGIPLLIELAELLQAAVVDTGDRFNFPSHHRLNLSDDRSLYGEADVILALEVMDLWSLGHTIRDVPGRPWKARKPEPAKLISLGTTGMIIRSNYQEFQRYAAVDLSIMGDAEATLPSLIAAVRSRIDARRKAAFAQRGEHLAQRQRVLAQQQQSMVDRAWDLNPVSPARMVMELWEQIKSDDWSLVGQQHDMPRRLWPMEKFYSHTGGTGAGGIGYGAPAAVGSALANRDEGRISVVIQPDGDLMYAPGILWTAAHHRIPLLYVMFNNRGYLRETMHIQRMAGRHERGIDTFEIGTTLRNPDIDFAKLAASMGVYSVGPVSDPSRLREALKRALAVVRKGEPALVDVVTQPR